MGTGDVRPPDTIAGARLLFSLDPAVSYLNHGTVGVTPIAVQRAQQRLRDEVELDPMRFYTRGLRDRVGHTRRHLATQFGADPDGTALIPNTTAGVAIVLQSMGLRAGDEILLTDHGYGSVAIAVARECRRTGAVARTVAVPLTAGDGEVVSLLRAAFTDRTRLLIVDQVASSTVKLFPLVPIVEAAHRANVAVLVDGAHAPGMLPLAVDGIGADFWVGNLHKWAFAPRSVAMLTVAPRWRDRIEPLAVSWDHDDGFPANVESQGTLDYSPWLSAPTGLFVLRTLGHDRVRAHNAALAAYGQRVIGAALGLRPADLPDPGGAGIAMRVVPLPSGVATTDADAVALRHRIADKLGAAVGINAWNSRGWLRISAQVYNQPDEYDRLAARLPALLTAGS
ncbi:MULTISPECIES: aminotransferase class V-fold PLP-dependent enzyme [Catenuloplanes]|uniref:Isopenicillin-N epimerase n=1 Tax=Catenuloplanes niger TaxID=587534 RepID=A0AAE3ZW05_9ACTN|nr:aminotransferase class V-fold PLP-dependent enzyme [Catenuloplanes niger]MDR7324900.1 isopenicillin-N epimerase [Catenuloplanes niger]